MNSAEPNHGQIKWGWRGAALLLLACLCRIPATIAQVSVDHAADKESPPPSSAYAGDAACARCHRKESEFYEFTPHARDSAQASGKAIVGSFLQGHNVLRTSNPNLVVNMVARPEGFYQSAVNLSNPENRLEERFDIVIGSGRHGQSYLYWQDDLLFELPASYWTWNHEWVTSPGFPAGQVHFDRAIVPRCLECHGSYFTSLAPPLNRYQKDSLVLGINCERCHGPGAKHVADERSSSPRTAKDDVAIVNPANLTRDRQLDLCALCHAGAVEPTRPPLTYIAGKDIHDYLAIQPPTPDAPPDVHGNQVGALEQSKCFISSRMTCSTCHNVHEKQEDADAFSRHCLSCHEMKACGKYAALGPKIRTKCVDCHMPLLESGKITSGMGTGTLHALLRAHQIKVYREASDAVEHSLTEKRGPLSH